MGGKYVINGSQKIIDTVSFENQVIRTGQFLENANFLPNPSGDFLLQLWTQTTGTWNAYHNNSLGSFFQYAGTTNAVLTSFNINAGGSLQAGSTLTISGWIYNGEASGASSIDLIAYNSSNANIGTVASLSLSSGSLWTFISESGIVPSGASYLQVSLNATALSTGSDIAFSRIKLEVGSTATPYSDEATTQYIALLNESDTFSNVTVTNNLAVGGSSNFTGKLTASTLQVTTGANANYVLTSDASGNATWQAAGVSAGVSSITGTDGITPTTLTTGAVTLGLNNATPSSLTINGSLTINASTSLTSANSGQLILVNTTGATADIVITLPTPALGLCYKIYGLGATTYTTDIAFTGTLYLPNGTSTTTSPYSAFDFGAEGQITNLITDGTNWYLYTVGGYSMLKGSSSQVFNVANATTATEAVSLGQSLAGATMNNVLSSRVIGTTYTNSSARPMVVYIGGTSAAAGDYLNAQTTIAGTNYYIYSLNATGAQQVLATSFIIPPSGNYIVGASSGVTMVTWFELV
jgi:hypothetical protein